MEHVKFGRSGLMVSRLCLGTMTFGLQRDEAGSRAILDAAAEGGVDFLDTADAYPLGGEQADRGRTEEIIGAWLQGRRGDFIVATKCVVPMGPHPWNRGMSRKHMLDAIDASLKRLRTDYVDLYQLHFYDDVTPMDEALEALDTIVRTGKARYVGVSNWPAYKVARAIGRTEVKGLAGIASVQPRYNLLFRSFERDLLPLCREEGIAVISYNPLAGGMLTGKHRMEGGPPEGTRFTLGNAGAMYSDRYWHARQFEAVEAIRKVADEAGMSLATLAVAWVLANPAITCPIIGASRPEQLRDSLAAADRPLPADVKARLDEITAEWRLVET